jgi:Ca2+-transporting ATPase
LYLNLVNDVFPALALGVGEGSDSVMQNDPKDPQEPILPSSQWWAIVVYGAVIAASVLLAFTLAIRRSDADTATTTAFLTVSLARLWHVFNMRDPNSGFVSNEISRNRYVWIALAICIALLAAAAFIPGLSDVLSMSLPDATGWGIIFGCSLLPLMLGQLYKLWQRR